MTHSGKDYGKHLEELAGYLFFPAFLFILNFFLKYIHLDTVQIGLDEPFTLFQAQKSPAEIAEALKVGYNPPLMEWLLHYWMALFGESPASVRFPSLLAASFTAVFLFLIGWRVRGLWAGLVGALAYTFASEHTYYAHEARVYALFAMLATASVWALLRLRERPDHRGRWLLLALLNAAMVWGHYFGFIVLGLEAAWVLLAKHPQKAALLKGALLSWALTALLYVPHMIMVWGMLGAGEGAHWVPRASLTGAYNVLAKFGNQPMVAVGMIVLSGVAAGRFLYRWWQGKAVWKAEIGLVLLMFPGGFALLWAMGLFGPVFLDRYAIFSMVFWYVVLGIALFSFDGYKVRIGLVLLLLGGLAFTTKMAPERRSQWREVTAQLHAERKADEPVWVFPKWNVLGLSYHYAPKIFQGDPARFETDIRAAGLIGIMKYMPLSLLDLKPDAPKIWIVSAGDKHADLHATVQSHLDSAYVVASFREDWHGITVKEYRRR